MRYWITGIVGIVLGSLMLFNQLLQGFPNSSGAYLVGQLTALGLGVVLVGAGIHYIRKAVRSR